MILLIDNYDSFAHNLARYFEMHGETVHVTRNDKMSIDEIRVLAPDAVVISPGPCTPNESGVSLEIIEELGPTTPILGVCLGFQAIAQVYGGRVPKSKAPVHGKFSHITHNATDIFEGLPNPMQVGRYHSLCIDIDGCDNLEMTASFEDIPMAVQHVSYPIYGVQFHPESILTPDGKTLIRNFLNITKRYNAQNMKVA